MNACVALSEAAIDEQDIKIHKIAIDSILSFDKTTQKIFADMVLECYGTINAVQAQDILDAGDELKVSDKWKHLVVYDENQFFRPQTNSIEAAGETSNDITTLLGAICVIFLVLSLLLYKAFSKKPKPTKSRRK